MAVAGSERKVLRVVQGLREATKGDISKKVGMSSDYVEYLCQYLVLGGYLAETKGSSLLRRYSITPEGEKALSGYVGAVGAQTPFAPGAGYHAMGSAKTGGSMAPTKGGGAKVKTSARKKSS